MRHTTLWDSRLELAGEWVWPLGGGCGLLIMTIISHEESVVRKAYFKMAQKYHPDKNPDGRVREV